MVAQKTAGAHALDVDSQAMAKVLAARCGFVEIAYVKSGA